MRYMQHRWFEVRDFWIRVTDPIQQRRLRPVLLQKLKTLNPNSISVPPGQEMVRDSILTNIIWNLEAGLKTPREIHKEADWTVDGVDGLYDGD